MATCGRRNEGYSDSLRGTVGVRRPRYAEAQNPIPGLGGHNCTCLTCNGLLMKMLLAVDCIVPLEPPQRNRYGVRN